MDAKNTHNGLEGIDFHKLRSILASHWPVMVFIFVAALAAAYLFLRYTKNVYEAESELKLDIKQDASVLNISRLQEEENLNVIAGEIEQIKSKYFLSRVIDSLSLDVTYFIEGKVLTDELYKRSPFEVKYELDKSGSLVDIPVFVDFDGELITLKLGEKRFNGRIGQPLALPGGKITITKNALFESYGQEDYFFMINSKPALVNYFLKGISVVPLNFNANTIKISFRDYNADKAHDIVNTIDSLYIIYSSEQKNLANRQKIEWLNNELRQVEKKMEDVENYFEDFTLQNKSNDLEQDLKRTVLVTTKIDSQRFELNKRLDALNNLMTSLSDESGSTLVVPKTFLPTPLNEQITMLQKLRHERARLGLSYNEITFAYRQKENELNSIRNSVYSQLTDIKKELLSQMMELAKQKDQLEKNFAAMPDKNTEMVKNRRFYKLYEEFYLLMMKSKAEFEIAEAGSTPDFKILSSATFPTQPISPNRIMIMGIAIMAGLVINFFFVGLMYLTSNKITSTQEVERLIDAPMLGVIPAAHLTSAAPIHVLENPKSMLSESIRILRTNLDFFATPTDRKVISVSSTISGEGKSFLALNLSAVLALSKKKVVLLDLDMRKHKNNGLIKVDDHQKGISTVLINRHQWQECILQTPLPNLDFLPCGPHPPNPSELLLNGDFTKLIDSLKSNYDFVVIDTPPVGLVTDGIMAMKKSDLSIYVVRANYSKSDFLQQFQRLIKINKIENVAVVVNAVPSSRKNYSYGYYQDVKEVKKSWTRFFKV